MAKFRSKPVEIEAEQFLPEKRPLPFDRYGAVVCLSPGGRWYAMTRVGSVGLRSGDWLIKLDGTPALFIHDVVRADIFEATYEPAPEAP